MKNLIIILFMFFSSHIYSQEQKFLAVIPKEYNNAETFVLLNSNKDTIISFNRNGHLNSIQTGGCDYMLKKRKVLFDNKGDTIAFFKRKKIIFPSYNIAVNEKKNKNGWSYYIGDHKVLEINYIYNGEEKAYQITALSEKLDDIILNLMQLSLGKFDKRVVMDYDDDNDFSTALIIAIIVATS